jgi:cytochrome P450
MAWSIEEIEELRRRGGIGRILHHDFDPTEPETFTSAAELYSELRQRCPVAHSNTYGGFWALFKYEDVVKALEDYPTFTTSVQNAVPNFAFTGVRPPLHLDPPDHSVYRRIINPFFTRERVERLVPAMKRDAAFLLQQIIDKGGGDVGPEFGHVFPAYVFSEFFNLPVDLARKIRSVTGIYVAAVNEQNHEVVKKYSYDLYEIAMGIIEERRKNPLDPEEDMTSAFLQAQKDGEPISDNMLLGTIRQLIVLGMVAPSVVLPSSIATLALQPEVQDMLRKDLSLIPAACEELFRMNSPYRGMSRTPTRDVVIRGHEIKMHEPVCIVYYSANRDEDVFPEPNKFILNRPNIQDHIAFGRGPHRCPAPHYMRHMLGITLEYLLSNTKHFELAGEIKMTKWAEWGALNVPIRVEV